MIYVYLKGDRYNKYHATYNGDKDMQAFDRDFETFEELENFLINISNYCSIPVQYYI